MYDNDLDADQIEQYQIVDDRILQLLVNHCVAAVFYDDDFAAVLLDIGQGADEHLCALVVFGHLVCLVPFVFMPLRRRR